jgi:DNA (cytosine-5)-methyltransferase 1
MRGLTFVDLFAGIGGFHHALRRPPINARCVLAVEKDPAARLVYAASFPGVPIVDDIRAITMGQNGSERDSRGIQKDVPDHDILCAGFPCQPFSKSGQQLGTSDLTRGTLFWDILRIIQVKKPRYVLLENVRNLTGPRHQQTLETILTCLSKAGYAVDNRPLALSPHELSPHRGGSPQARDRVFIGATRRDVGRTPNLHRITEILGDVWNPRDWRIEGILQHEDLIANRQDYLLNAEEISWLDCWNYLIQSIPDNELPSFPIWSDDFVLRARFSRSEPDWKNDYWRKNSLFYQHYRDLIDSWRARRFGPARLRVRDFPRSRRKFEWQARDWQTTTPDRDIWKLLVQFRPSGIRVRPPTYTPALVAITQTSIIGPRRRRLTPLECARLQGFDSAIFENIDLPDAIKYRQLGNAVHTGVAHTVAKFLITGRLAA